MKTLRELAEATSTQTKKCQGSSYVCGCAYCAFIEHTDPIEILALLDERDALRAELEALKVDAARYRMIKELDEDMDSGWALCDYSGHKWMPHGYVELDKTMDELMGAKT